MGLATLLLVGVMAVRHTIRSPAAAPHNWEVEILPGSAVGDLQTLEEVEKMSGDSDLLDQLAPEDQHVADQN